MLNQVAAEALYSATYVDNYLDSVENLPDDIQRYVSRIREIDVQHQGELRFDSVRFVSFRRFRGRTSKQSVLASVERTSWIQCGLSSEKL